jgi:hypothetical protein
MVYVPLPPSVRLLNVVAVTVGLEPVYCTVEPVIVNVLLPERVRGVLSPVRIIVSPVISKFWLESTVIEEAVTFEEVLRVVGVPLTVT